MTIKTPVQLFINGKFFAIVSEVEIKYNDPQFKKSLLPDNVKLDPGQFTGTVINIKKQMPSLKREIEARAKEKSNKDYDAFFHKMVGAIDDPDAHLPIE
jgi:soluble cytochrome b562